MKNSFNARNKVAIVVSAIGAVVLAAVILKLGHVPAHAANDKEGSAVASSNTVATAVSSNSLELTPGQLSTLVIAPVGSNSFPIEKEAVGNIDFDYDHSVQVFPNYQGKLLKTFVELGDDVHKGDPLYTIDSPDLVQAESTVIAAAATLDLTDKELARAKDLYATNYGVSQRELEQAINDQQAADGALKAARDALRVFGKTEAEISQIIATRKIDSTLVVPSPISGQITAKNAPTGYFVQPGTPPAPYSVADLSVKWMFGDVIESDSPFFRAGQPVEVKVMAYPGRVFKGKINKVYETVDANVHTLQIRSEISDPTNELRPGMLANFVIRVQDPIEAIAIPANGVVREGDGSMSAWVTTDRHRFTQRPIKIGMRHNQMVQVVDGLQPGELVVADGAVFLSNMLNAPPSD
jgi:cobalt-zinc-cadmium efflux system membrane fusion protein